MGGAVWTVAGRILDRDGPGPCTHARMPESQSSTCSTQVRPGAQLLSIILFFLFLLNLSTGSSL